ncbi:MAG: hypothetical protein M3X11_03205 [Acidobacteriota bacterium]|nr:hypothetical protein [Acidobacteriota bacterium]
MIKDVFASIGAAARKLLTNFGAVLIALLFYSALWLTGYAFFNTGLATQWQVALNIAVLPLLALILFFVLQAIGLSYVRIGVGAGYLLKRALKDFWKLLVISLPLALLVWALVKLFGYLDTKFVASATKQASRWPGTVVTIARWLLLYGLLPLWAIHLWMRAIREGLGPAFKGIGRSLLAALSPRSVLIYVIVLAALGALAYFIAFTKTPIQSEWAELWVVGTRFALALLLPFFAWMLTLGAMAEMVSRRALSEFDV